jgi:hypothetical protein
MKNTLRILVLMVSIAFAINLGLAVSDNGNDGMKLPSEETLLSSITRFPPQDSTRSISEAIPFILADQSILFVWADSTSIRYSKSTDGGSSWNIPNLIVIPARFANLLTGLRTSSGRLLLFWRDSLGVRSTKSDDNGASWSAPLALGTTASSLQLSKTLEGKLWLGLRPPLGASRFTISSDNGTTWSAFQLLPTPQKDEISFFTGQGNAVHCIYSPTGPPDIERITSTDGGATWSAPVPILNSSSLERRPRIARQSNGTVWLIYDYKRADSVAPSAFQGFDVQYIRSTDSGISWSAPTSFTRYRGNDLMNNVAMINDRPFVAFASDRWARGLVTTNLPTQIWYGIIGDTPDNNPPPILLSASTHHQYSDLENWIRARVDDEAGIASVTAQYSINGSVYVPLDMFDDGMHFDGRPGDNVWGTEPIGFWSGVVTCRFTVRDVTNSTLPEAPGIEFTTSSPLTFPFVRQGRSMHVVSNDRGTFGQAVYSSSYSGFGMRYPTNSIIEHLYGAGIWVGGKVDTTSGGTGQRIKAVSTAYEGGNLSVPQFEFYPGFGPADSIWRVFGRNAPRPIGWDAYWGNALPFRAVADENFFNQYSDYRVRPSGHVPMALNVIQSSYTWHDEEGIQILDFRIRNESNRNIDSAYVGLFADGDVGPVDTTNYFFNNCSGYFTSSRTAYIQNPVNFGSTPFGMTVLNTHRPMDSVRLAFQWYSLGQSPPNDGSKYDLMSSGIIKPDQCPQLSDTRFLISFGPFTIRPAAPPTQDTLRVAFALLSAMDLSQLQVRASRVRAIYGGIVGVQEAGPATPHGFTLGQNYPNPFNPSTEIKFSVETVGRTTLEVSNIIGQKVATLFDDVAEPGRYYKVRFGGANLASGVYLYRLRSGKRSELKKLLLLK